MSDYTSWGDVYVTDNHHYRYVLRQGDCSGLFDLEYEEQQDNKEFKTIKSMTITGEALRMLAEHSASLEAMFDDD